jgi:hypothetical protein
MIGKLYDGRTVAKAGKHPWPAPVPYWRLGGRSGGRAPGEFE